MTFAFIDLLEGVDLRPAALPELADEGAIYETLAATMTEILKPQVFGAAMTGDEMLAWLEASLAREQH